MSWTSNRVGLLNFCIVLCYSFPILLDLKEMGETADKDVAKKRSDRDENPKEKSSNSITSKHVVLFSFLVGIISVLVYLIVVEPLMLQQDMSGNFYDNYAAGADNISRQVLDLFMSYDENLDGKLSVKEFVPIAERIQGTLGTQVKISSVFSLLYIFICLSASFLS